MTENGNNKIIEFLYSVNYFPRKAKLKNIVKKANSEITEKEISDFYDNEITGELTKKQNEKAEHGHMVAYFVNELWLLDIIDMVK